MATIECPACKEMISTLLPKCPKCGAARKRDPGRPSSKRVESETITWAKKWAHIGAWSVLAGFLVPVPLPQITPDGLIWAAGWTWDFFKTPFVPIGFAAPPLAGVAILLLIVLSREDLLPRFMTFIGAFTLVVEIALGVFLTSDLGGHINGEPFAIPLMGPFLACALAAIGAFVVAAGNHVRKTHPVHRWPRRMSVLGGILLLLLFAIPWWGSPPIMTFFSGEAWRMAWPVMVPLLAVLAYGIAGLTRLGSRSMSLLGRGALLLIPAFFIVLDFITFDTMRGRAPVALVIMKVFLTLYGGLVIFAAGLAALLILKLKSGPRVELIATPQPARGLQE